MDATLAEMMDPNWWTGFRMMTTAGIIIFLLWLAKATSNAR